MSAQHLTVCQRLVGAAFNIRKPSIQATQHRIRLCTQAVTDSERRLTEKLEAATGLSIEQLEIVSRKWLTLG